MVVRGVVIGNIYGRTRTRGFSPASVTSNHAIVDSSDDSGLLVIGRLAEIADPEEYQDALDNDDLGYRPGDTGLDPYVTMPRAMITRHQRPSRVVVSRMRGDPSAFISAPAGGGLTAGSGALFIDTDGRRVQDGDDF